MRTRVTFRIAPDLADALRDLPNQTRFVERALRDALGKCCPVCEGRGRVSHAELHVSDFRDTSLPPLDREGALHLKDLVRLGRQVAATRLGLARGREKATLDFELARGNHVLLRGRLDDGLTLHPN